MNRQAIYKSTICPLTSNHLNTTMQHTSPNPAYINPGDYMNSRYETRFVTHSGTKMIHAINR